MLERPEKVKIGPYDVRFITMDRDGEHDTWGCFSKLGQTIGIMREYPTPQTEAETVIHETLHAIFWERGLKNKDEEKIVAALGIGLAQVIRDNPALIDWLRDKLK